MHGGSTFVWLGVSLTISGFWGRMRIFVVGGSVDVMTSYPSLSALRGSCHDASSEAHTNLDSDYSWTAVLNV